MPLRAAAGDIAGDNGIGSAATNDGAGETGGGGLSLGAGNGQDRRRAETEEETHFHLHGDPVVAGDLEIWRLAGYSRVADHQVRCREVGGIVMAQNEAHRLARQSVHGRPKLVRGLEIGDGDLGALADEPPRDAQPTAVQPKAHDEDALSAESRGCAGIRISPKRRQRSSCHLPNLWS